MSIFIVIGFLSLVFFISYSYNEFLNQLEVVLSEGEIESKKMQINSELMELARSRTRITLEIIDTEDYFKKDDLNMQLDSYAGQFTSLRMQLLTLPLTEEEQSIVKRNDETISKILPAQRSAVELSMMGLKANKLRAKNILYDVVLPGQEKLIRSLGQLVTIEQNKIARLTEKSNHSLLSIKKRNIQAVTVVAVIASMLSVIVVLRIRKVQLELRVYSKTLQQIIESLEQTVNERTRELSALNVQLKDCSEQDVLTGLFNRRKFNAFIDDEYARSTRLGTCFSLILIDIDYFKLYNDNYGHLKGDQCLTSVAKVMSEALPRSIDFIARYGGEEFVIVLPSTELEGARQVANIIRDAVINENIEHAFSKVEKYITISQGITTYHAQDSLSISEIINDADEALYLAKSNGRNRVESNKQNSTSLNPENICS
ncbi:MAG: GGDEF domain-containing protein [Gammaproteobacteria bacterium]|nr:GGDEF domain-containing protein [Gammaproteobacteria bacterium]